MKCRVLGSGWEEWPPPSLPASPEPTDRKQGGRRRGCQGSPHLVLTCLGRLGQGIHVGWGGFSDFHPCWRRGSCERQQCPPQPPAAPLSWDLEASARTVDFETLRSSPEGHRPGPELPLPWSSLGWQLRETVKGMCGSPEPFWGGRDELHLYLLTQLAFAPMCLASRSHLVAKKPLRLDGLASGPGQVPLVRRGWFSFGPGDGSINGSLLGHSASWAKSRKSARVRAGVGRLPGPCPSSTGAPHLAPGIGDVMSGWGQTCHHTSEDSTREGCTY